jgi:methyl coenzyme M reductase subunit C-like uncharacterized protein (methanogenesis marker protein 7)
MPILVVMSEASYHAPYDHCTVKYLQQAGAQPTFMRLADIGIKGNSHVMMNEKNNKEIAAVIAQWLGKTGKRIERRTTFGTPGRRMSICPSAPCA